MHSSRIRTDWLLTVSLCIGGCLVGVCLAGRGVSGQAGVSSQKGYVWSGGVSDQGVSCEGMVCLVRAVCLVGRWSDCRQTVVLCPLVCCGRTMP